MGMIIANVFPKSGTGLIRQILSPFGKDHGHLKMFWGPTGEKVPTRKTKALMGIMRNEEGVMTAHLHWDVQFAELFRENKMLLLIRDPRDIIVSHAQYIKNEPIHHLHKYYKNEPIQKCIFQSMVGLPDAVDGYGSPDPFPDIANRFLPYIGWAHMDNVLVVRYEDLIGENKEVICYEIAQHILPMGTGDRSVANWMDMVHESVPLMLSSVKPSESITFRSGKVGTWKAEASLQNIHYYNEHFSWLDSLMARL